MLGILSEEMIEQVLQRNVVGRIGYTDGKKVYIVPVNYWYTGKYIIIHSREGKKMEILRQRPDICFELEEIEGLSDWKSVIVWGKFEELTEPRERYYASDLLIRSLNKAKISETALPKHHFDVSDKLVLPDDPKSVVYRIRIEEKAGRFEQSDDV